MATSFEGDSDCVQPGVVGLQNTGNSDYVNVVIQCLSNTASLTTFFISDNYVKYLNKTNVLGTGGKVTEAFATVIKYLWSEQNKVITPRDFKTTLARHWPPVDSSEGGDAKEFLLVLLDFLHEDLNKVKTRVKTRELTADGLTDDVAAKRSWQMHKVRNDSIIGDMFHGQIKTTVVCSTCRKKSVNFDVFMTLDLEIPSQDKCSLSECLMSFSNEQVMKGHNQPYCSQCLEHRDAVKTTGLWEMPPIVIICIKRAQYDPKSKAFVKSNTMVDYPLVNLDFTPYICGAAETKPYDLYAVCDHWGNRKRGHYTTSAKHPKLKEWFMFDDDKVRACAESDVKSSAAYVLFYSSIGNVVSN